MRENKFSPAALEGLSERLYSNAQSQSSSFPEVVQLEKRWQAALLQVARHACIHLNTVGLSLKLDRSSSPR